MNLIRSGFQVPVTLQRARLWRSPAVVLACLALAGCAVYPPEASGPYRGLNPGKWQPTPDNLRDDRLSTCAPGAPHDIVMFRATPS